VSREQHRVLVGAAERWLRRRGFGVIGTEIFAAGCREQADAIGFRTNGTALVECKTSLADFRADAKKPERQLGGLGVYRFYMSPPALITPEMLPPRWGLLWADGRNIEEIRVPQGNAWPAFNPQYPHGDWTAFMHAPDLDAERLVLFSIARRLARGESPARR
jgi:hypothetical protein